MHKIVIDPGHGGADPGAIGLRGTREADINLAVAKRVRAYLEPVVEVTLTREADSTVSLGDRCQIANDVGSDLFVSIHCNSSISPDPHGMEVFCLQKGGKGEQLAKEIHDRFITILGPVDRGIKEANFKVLRDTRMPAALIEMAFISNPDEESKLKTVEFQNNAARAIALGICDHLGLQLPVWSPEDPKNSPWEQEKKAAVEWAKKNGLIHEFDDFGIRQAVVLYRYHQKGGCQNGITA